MLKRKRIFDETSNKVVSIAYDTSESGRRDAEDFANDPDAILPEYIGKKFASVPRILYEKWRNEEGFDLLKASDEEIAKRLNSAEYKMLLAKQHNSKWGNKWR